ncbi:hypothetical protein [Actinomadura sp. 9N407]|uniref:hypothetical protein n=1 Tax=Actinomadura sp. 9N407 TaxID=3375154 RepID=UPI0037B04AD9
MNGIVAAFGATGLYYVGFAVFKLAADRMEPLRGDRILHLARVILFDWVFLAGLALVLGGLGLQILALTEVSLGIAVPIFMSGVVPLLLIALVFFGERLTGREWLSLLLIAAAMGLIAASIGNPPPITAADVPVWQLAVVVAPALLVPLVVLLTGESRPDGRHARPITGIAYGLGTGIPIGTAELSIKGWSDSGLGLGSLLTPYPYVTVVSATIGFGILMMAFQRCRVSVVATVMTVSAKTHLLVTGTLLYGEPWPDEPRYFAMRVAALALGVIAVVQFPRHRPVTEPAEPADDVRVAGAAGRPGRQVPPARDPFGEPALARFGPGRAAGSGPLPQPLSAPTPADGPPPAGRSAFDRPKGQAPPGPSGTPRSSAGHLAPDRGSGPYAFGQASPSGFTGQRGQGEPGYREAGRGEAGYGDAGRRQQPPPVPPKPSPYARDPLGRGPYGGPDPFDDDAYEIQEQFGTGPYGIVQPYPPEQEAENERRPPG